MPIDGYSFQLSSDVYRGGIDVVDMGQIKNYVQKLVHFEKIMGKNLQNELWACLVASKLSELRPPEQTRKVAYYLGF